MSKALNVLRILNHEIKRFFKLNIAHDS